MPAKRPYRKKTTVRRKAPFRRKRHAARSSVMVSHRAPISDRYLCRLKYAEHVTLVTGVAPTSQLWRANSLFDPNQTGVGHQPLGFDQLSALYNQYRVYGCKYRITFHNQNTANLINVAVVKKKDNSVSTVFSTIEEKPYAQTDMLNISLGSHSSRTFTGYASCARMLGVTKNTYNADDQFTAAVTANPTANPTIQCYVHEIAGLTGYNVHVDVQLEYYCVFFGRVPLTQS